MVEGLKERMKYLRGASGRSAATKVQNSEPSSSPKPFIEPKSHPDPPSIPIIPEGEDQHSHDRHAKLLSVECRKVNPNSAVKKKLMDHNFPFRRKEIISNPTLVSTITKIYPPLKEYIEVRQCNIVNLILIDLFSSREK